MADAFEALALRLSPPPTLAATAKSGPTTPDLQRVLLFSAQGGGGGGTVTADHVTSVRGVRGVAMVTATEGATCLDVVYSPRLVSFKNICNLMHSAGLKLSLKGFYQTGWVFGGVCGVCGVFIRRGGCLIFSVA